LPPKRGVDASNASGKPEQAMFLENARGAFSGRGVGTGLLRSGLVSRNLFFGGQESIRQLFDGSKGVKYARIRKPR